MSQFQHISVSNLAVSPRNVRQSASSKREDQQLQSLIAVHGVLCSLVARTNPEQIDGYHVIAVGDYTLSRD